MGTALESVPILNSDSPLTFNLGQETDLSPGLSFLTPKMEGTIVPTS